MYLLDYGRRDFPFLKRRLKKLDRKLKRHQACGGLFARDQVERRRLGRIQALSTEIASHVHVATATFRKPGMRKFLAGGIGRNLCHLREKKHSCVIELPDGDAQSDDLGDASDFEAFLDELSRETVSIINTAITGALSKQIKTAEWVAARDTGNLNFLLLPALTSPAFRPCLSLFPPLPLPLPVIASFASHTCLSRPCLSRPCLSRPCFPFPVFPVSRFLFPDSRFPIPALASSAWPRCLFPVFPCSDYLPYKTIVQ